MRFEAKVGDVIYLAMFTSTSDDPQVAQSFASDVDGIMFEFEDIGAQDVSWMYVVASRTSPLLWRLWSRVVLS